MPLPRYSQRLDTPPAAASRRRAGVYVLALGTAVAAVFVLLAMLEGALSLLVAHPPDIGIWVSAVREYHAEWERSIVQLRPECAHYDSSLGYALNPGTCHFVNREFDVALDVDHLGFRDDEASLDAPAIVLLGDSFGMGWGVPQDSTFAEVLQRETGLRTLNTAVSSYGTARELAALRRVDLSRARYVVIQYCDNDYPENRDFLEVGRVVPRSREAYDSLVASHLRNTRYHPGKYLVRLVPILGRQLHERFAPGSWVPGARDLDEARAFLQALDRGGVDLSQAQLVVFELSAGRWEDDGFAAALRQELAAGDYPDWLRRMRVLDVAPLLAPADRYFFDDHLRSPGHMRIGQLLASEIRGMEARTQ